MTSQNSWVNGLWGLAPIRLAIMEAQPSPRYLSWFRLGFLWLAAKGKCTARILFPFVLFLISNWLSRWKMIKHKTNKKTTFSDARWPDQNLRLSGSQCQDVTRRHFHSSQIPGVSAPLGLSWVDAPTGSCWMWQKELTWQADLRGSGRQPWVWGKQVREPHLGKQAAFPSTVTRLLERIEIESIFIKKKDAIRTSGWRGGLNTNIYIYSLLKLTKWQ